MIKNSTLIGRAVPLPAGWKRFKVGELFDVIMPHLQDTRYAKRWLPEIKAQSANHGISGYRTAYPSLPYGLTLGMRGSINCYYQDDFVYLGNNVAGLTLKPHYHHGNDRAVYLFLSQVLIVNNYRDSSGYMNYPTYHKLTVTDTLNLPIMNDGQPDFDWIARYMDAVRQQTLARRELANAEQIKAYLTESGQDGYEDTISDREFMRLWHNLPTKTFKADAIFDVIRPVKDNLSAFLIPFDKTDENESSMIDCVTAGIRHNGLPFKIPSRYVKLTDIHHDGITVSANGINTGALFVQCTPFVIVQDAYGLTTKSGVVFNHWNYLYCAAALNKFKPTFDYQTKATWTRLRQCEIALPIMNDHIATAEITHFMKLQARPLIDSTTACIIGGVRINLSAITYFMNIQTKRMIAAKKQQFDRELKIMKQV